MDTKAPEGAKTRSKRRIYYGWWIVGVAFLSDFISGANAYGFPIFYKPMAKELGWSRTTVAIAPTLRTVFSALLLSPIIGRMVDRRGPQAIMLVGAILMGVTSLGMTLVGEVWQYILVYSIIGAAAVVSEGNLVTMATVSKWFVRKRGRATAFVTLGVSLGGLAFTPVGTYLVVHYSWHAGWIFLGILSWILLVPSSFFMRRQPEDMGLLPDDARPSPTASPTQAIGKEAPQEGRRADAFEEIWTLQQAIRSPAFWLILMAFNLGSMSISAVTLHQFNYITDKGFSEATAASVVTLYAFLAIVAKVIYGFVSERVHIRYLTMVSMIGGGIAISIFNFATSAQSLYIYAVVYGLTRGAFILVTPLAWANYFGRTFQGTIRGFTGPFGLISSAGGPLFGAWVFDHYGSYQGAFVVFSATFLIGAFLMYLAKPTKPPVLKRATAPEKT